MKKEIKFSVLQLIINDQPFTIESFVDVVSQVIDKGVIRNSDTGESEVTSIKKVKKDIHEDRFVSLYFNSGDRFPYSPKVIKADDKEYDNPRSPDEFELQEQFFVLMDVTKQRIYISDQRKKKSLKSWLDLKLKKEVVIKSIVQENEFVKKIKSVNSICFTVVPNLFNAAAGSILSESLVQDIYGFDAEKAKVQVIYNNKGITNTVIEKIKALIQNKGNFEEIVVIGRDEEDFESVFNLEEIVSKLTIEANADNKTGLFESGDVFTALLEKVK